jgi:hypothetical protein
MQFVVIRGLSSQVTMAGKRKHASWPEKDEAKINPEGGEKAAYL